jgi:hypothetical protein
MAEDIAGAEWRREALRTRLISHHEKGPASVSKLAAPTALRRFDSRDGNSGNTSSSSLMRHVLGGDFKTKGRSSFHDSFLIRKTYAAFHRSISCPGTCRKLR